MRGKTLVVNAFIMMVPDEGLSDCGLRNTFLKDRTAPGTLASQASLAVLLRPTRSVPPRLAVRVGPLCRFGATTCDVGTLCTLWRIHYHVV